MAEAALWKYALRLLSGRGYSVSELRQRLRRRAVRPRDIEPVLDRLQEYGYLNDRRYAETYAAARLENDRFGRARVLRDLKHKQVSGEVAEEVVSRLYEKYDETSLIEQYLEKKFRRVRLADFLSERKNLLSAYRRLRYAGYSSGNSIRVLKRYSERAEELDGSEEEETG